MSYRDPTGEDDAASLQRPTGEDAPDFVFADVVNGSTVHDSVAPAPSGPARANDARDELRLRFSRALDVGNLPAADAFEVTFGRSRVAVSRVLASTHDVKEIVLEVSPSIPSSARRATVTYTDPTSRDDAKAIQNRHGVDAASFRTPVTGLEDPGAGPLRAEFRDLKKVHGGNAFTFELAFTAEVVAGFEVFRGTVERPSVISVTNGRVTGVSRVVDDSNRRWNVTVEPDSHVDVSIALPATTDCTAPNAICTDDSRRLVSGVSATVLARSPAQTAPLLEGSEASTGAMVLTYREALDEASTPAAEAFAVMVAGRARSLAATDPVVVRGATVTLTFASPAAPGDTVTVSYTAPSTDPLQDTSGNQAASVTVEASVPKPALTASFEGAPETHRGESFALRLRFSEPVGVTWTAMRERLLDVTNGQITRARRLERSGRSSDEVWNALWEITIEPSLGDVTVELPATAHCWALDAVCTQDYRPLSALARVTVPMGTLPPLTATKGEYPAVHDRAELDLEVSFSVPVTLTPEAMRDHALTVTNAELVSVSRAADDEKRWRFRVLPLSNETVTVEIPVPTDCAATGAVCTADGRMLASAVRWEIAPRDPSAIDAAGPEPVSAEVERASLVLVYGEGLDEASVPAAEAFTVTVAGAVRSLASSGPVTVSGRRVFLALASTVAPGDEVTVSYAVPPENRLQDRADNDAPAVSDLAVTNATPPFTVRFEEGSVPETHDGVNRVAFRLAFSEEPAQVHGRWVSQVLRSAVVMRVGGDRIYPTEIERLDDTGRRRWQMKVRFKGGFALATGDLTVTINPTRDCAAADALCTEDGWKLSNRISARIRYAPSLSVAGANAAEASGATVDFPVTLSRALARRVTVDYATSDGTATAGRDYTGVAGTLTFAPGETQKTVSVPVLDDGDNEEAETLTLTLSNASGAGTVIRTASATGTIEDDPADRPLTAKFVNVPAEHDGTAFAFGLAFSEELPVSAETLRDHAFAVTGGVVTAADKVDAASSRSWRITVTPSSVAQAVTIALAPKGSCDDEGAICTGDARPLSATVEAEVPGREPTHVVSATLASGPGENGAWDTDETVTAEVVFNREVAVYGPPGVTPTLGITLDGMRREAALTSTGSTATLTFSHTVTDDDGAQIAAIVANGITLNGTAIADNRGNEAQLTFSMGPALSVADVSVTEGPGATADFVVTLDPAASETVTVDYATADGTATAPADYTSTSGTLTFAEGETSKTVSVPVVDDDDEDEGETFTLTLSNPSGGGAHLVDATATATARNDDTAATALTAEFLDLPDAHGGNAFTVDLRFSEDVTGLSYATLRDHAFTVTGGTVTGARRLDADGEERDREWEIAVAPAANAGDVTVTLPATTDCTATGAICAADARPLSAAVSATVPRTVSTETPFRVRLSDVPDEHDGSTPIVFRVLFNKKPAADYSYVTMRDSTVRARRDGAAVAVSAVERLNKPHNDRWLITIPPGGKEDVTVSVGPFSSCSDAGAVCTGDGVVLSNAVTQTVLGPPGLSVADARVYEAPGATLDFAVTLGRASASTVSVDYATSDGTATAGEDYTAASGTLTFAPGETAKTVSVPVLGDDHDEGEETLTLTLSNPSGGNAWLKDAVATGTIENSDAMPRAWLARFGRTVAEQVMETVESRFQAARTAGVEATLAGQTLPSWNGSGSGNTEGEDAEARRTALAEEEAHAGLEAMTRWLAGTEDGTGRPAAKSRAVTPRDLLTGTSFAVTGEAKAGGLVSLWGRGAVSSFDGREGDLTLEGEVTSAMLGADWTREQSTVGLMLNHARGEGSYRGEGEGLVSSTLTGLFPYGRYLVSDGVTVWGVAGYGAGELVLTPEDQSAIRTDTDLTMGAVGVRGVAVEAGPQGGFELAVTSDAMAVRTTSEKTEGLAAAEADVNRLGFGLEGTWRGLEAGGGELVPRLEIGLRHDGGDAETGFGLDLGGGLSWSHPASGLSAEFSGRGLLTHESRGFRDRGLSGSFAWDPGQGSGRGPSLTLTQTVGASASGGMHALLGHRHLGALAANDDGNELEHRQLEARLGYGFGVFGDRFTATPEAGLGLSDSHRELSLGWRLGLARRGPVSMELGLVGTRREAANDDAAEPEHAFMLRGQFQW